MMVKKVSTGVDGLDSILNGGYLKSKPTLLKGGPGSGKTVFTLLFAHAQIEAGEQVIFITCDEKPEQIISHMDGFGLKGSKHTAEGKLLFLDFTQEFSDEVIGEFDLSAILLRIKQAKEQFNAQTLIIDSLQAMLLGLANYDPKIELLHLFTWTRNEKLTVLTTIAGDLGPMDTALYEEYIVDCAIELTQQLKNNLMTRYLRVVKLRGSAHGTNKYPFSIIQSGISLLPITDSVFKTLLKNKYLSTGNHDMDRMLGNKGYQLGSLIMFSGRSGTGKTIFVATLAQTALLKKKKVLFISFEESPSDLVQHLESVGIDFKPFIENKMLSINSRRSIEMGMEDHIISIIELIKKGKFELVILDPITSLLDLGDVMDLKMMFIRFTTELKSSNTTIIFTELLTDTHQEISCLGLSSLTDTWIRLRRMETDGEFNRLIYISKSRGSNTSNQLKEFLITNEGIKIEDPYIGEGEMVFGSKKAMMILQEKNRLQQYTEEISQLDLAIKAIEEELATQNAIHNTEYINKKNALWRQREELRYKEKQARERELVNKQRRD